MSAGKFIRSRYQLDNDTIIPIKIQEETELLAVGEATNQSPAQDAVKGYGSARVGGGEREIGIRARGVVFKFDGTPPPGYKVGAYLRLPCLTKTFWNACVEGAAGSYTINGTSYTIEVISSYKEELH